VFDWARDVLKAIYECKRVEKSGCSLQRFEKRVMKVEKLLSVGYDFNSAVREWLEAQKGVIRSRREKVLDEFAVELERLLKDLGFSLRGQYPLLRAGLFYIEVFPDEFYCRVWYGPKQEFIGRVELDSKRVFKLIRDTWAYLEKRMVSDEEFVSKLRVAYDRVANGGRKAPIIRVLSEMAWLLQDKSFLLNPKKENYKSYDRVKFSFDLFRLGSKPVNGFRTVLITATRSQAKRRRSCLWVPRDLNGNGSVYAFLRVEEVRE